MLTLLTLSFSSLGAVTGVEGSAEDEVVKSIRKSDKTDSAGRCVRVEKKLGARLACFLRAEEDSEADGASAAEEATGEEGVEVEVVGAVEIGIAGREERGAGFGSGRARREPDDDDDLALEELPRLLDWKVMPVAVLVRIEMRQRPVGEGVRFRCDSPWEGRDLEGILIGIYRRLVEVQERSAICDAPGPPGLYRVLLGGRGWENDEGHDGGWFTEVGGDRWGGHDGV